MYAEQRLERAPVASPLGAAANRAATEIPRDATANRAATEAPRGAAANRTATDGPRSAATSAAGRAAIAPVGADPAQAVAITVSPLEWRTLPFAGQPALVAVRQVETPDGRLAQGFVVDRTALTGWLAGHAGDAVAELRTGDTAAPRSRRAGTSRSRRTRARCAPPPADATALARGFVLAVPRDWPARGARGAARS